MFDVNSCKLLQTEEDKWETPTSRQRGRPTETRQQLSEINLRTEIIIWSHVPEWARYLEILIDRPSVVTWLWLIRKLTSHYACFIPYEMVSILSGTFFFYKKQHYCHPLPTLRFSVPPDWRWRCRPPFWLSWDDGGTIAGGIGGIAANGARNGTTSRVMAASRPKVTFLTK
jgi:hypothetical protein